jgi:3-isopropylmalate dehydrogenase
MEKKIAIIRGDGIGPEIMTQALAVLDAIAKKFGHTLPMWTHPWAATPSMPSAFSAGVQPENLFGGGQRPALRHRRPQVGYHRPGHPSGEGIAGSACGHGALCQPASVQADPQLKEASPCAAISWKKALTLCAGTDRGAYFGEHKTFTENGEEAASD